jgi:hypothetical protein
VAIYRGGLFVRKTGALRIGIVLLLASVAAGVFAVVGRADDPVFDQKSSSLQPGFIVGGNDVLYKTQWHDNDNRTFTHAKVEIYLPSADWTLVSSSPSGCTKAGTTVTCQWGTLHFGDLVSQTVRLTSTTATGTKTVDSALLVYEGPQNPGRAQSIASDGFKQVEVIDQASQPNKAGGCVGANVSLGTVAGVGESDTTATAPSTDQLCTPITIDERQRTSPSEFCVLGRQCVSDIVLTDAVPVLPTDPPIKLKIVFRGTGLNNLSLLFTSANGTSEVQACTDPNVASPDPCWYDKRARQQSATWFLNWTGVDPGWDL